MKSDIKSRPQTLFFVKKTKLLYCDKQLPKLLLMFSPTHLFAVNGMFNSIPISQRTCCFQYLFNYTFLYRSREDIKRVNQQPDQLWVKNDIGDVTWQHMFWTITSLLVFLAKNSIGDSTYYMYNKYSIFY